MKGCLVFLLIVLLIALYFDWANYSLGFDAGKSSNVNDVREIVSSHSFESGRKVGVAAGQQTCESEIERRVQERERASNDQLAKQFDAAMKGAFEQGRQAEAKLVIDNALRFSKAK